MRALLLLLALTLLPALVYSAQPVPNFIDYQGKLLDHSGAPVASGLVQVEFRIWNQADGGTIIWAERQFVTVVNGDISVRLGAGQPIVQSGEDIGFLDHTAGSLASVFLGNERYLGITVLQGEEPKEIAPRFGFISTPYAILSQAANSLDQAPGTESKVRVSGIAFSTQTLTTTQTLVLDKHTNLVNAQEATVTATLPTGGSEQSLVVAKIDESTNMVTISPGAGTINGVAGASGTVYLKVRGESVTLQNAGANDWWIVADSRDRTPVGTVYSHGAATPPPGYLICDGKLYDNTRFPELRAALVTAWGGNGTQFNVPDLAGRFLRGVDPTGARDPDAGSRLASATGGNTGATPSRVGSVQLDQFRSHTHTAVLPGHNHDLDLPAGLGLIKWGGADQTPGGLDKDGSGEETDVKSLQNLSIDAAPGLTGTIEPTTGAETRPINAYVTYIVKY
jgi:hypothetical protein